jgi:hypothetical protein
VTARPGSQQHVRRARLARLGVLGLLLAQLLAAGCAAQVYRREHLVDPIMSFDAEAKLNARKMKTFEAREGSTGGIGGAGGGCACK